MDEFWRHTEVGKEEGERKEIRVEPLYMEREFLGKLKRDTRRIHYTFWSYNLYFTKVKLLLANKGNTDTLYTYERI